MKKIFAMILAVAMVMSFAACGSKTPDTTDVTDSSETTTETAETQVQLITADYPADVTDTNALNDYYNVYFKSTDRSFGSDWLQYNDNSGEYSNVVAFHFGDDGNMVYGEIDGKVVALQEKDGTSVVAVDANEGAYSHELKKNDYRMETFANMSIDAIADKITDIRYAGTLEDALGHGTCDMVNAKMNGLPVFMYVSVETHEIVFIGFGENGECAQSVSVTNPMFIENVSDFPDNLPEKYDNMAANAYNAIAEFINASDYLK